MKRLFSADQPELMDLPQPVSDELRKDLQNLVSLNRHFGSHSTVSSFLRRWIRSGSTIRVLDLATGAGDIPRLMVRWARAHGVSMEITAVDIHPATLEIARGDSAAYPEIEWREGDARTFESSAPYDLVCCSLALHHFSEMDAICILKRCSELSSRYALIVDLERSLLAYWGIWLVTEFIFREEMTRHDGRLSAKRAFSWSELKSIATQADWSGFGQRRAPVFRQAVWLDKLASS